MNGDIDETNINHRQKQTNQQRRTCFNNNKIDATIEENLASTTTTLDNPHEETNTTNKSFKRKAVSFSAMPFEKKVVDGKNKQIKSMRIRLIHKFSA